MTEAERAERAARERARMEQGDTLADVVRRLRADAVPPLEAFDMLRRIKTIRFGTAKEIIDDAWHDKCPDLDLDDLALLASVPVVCKAAWWLPGRLDHAIIARKPSLQFEGEHRDEVKRAIAEEPAWAREIEVVRDDDVFEIRFVRVR
jgi:hypothetical protein